MSKPAVSSLGTKYMTGRKLMLTNELRESICLSIETVHYLKIAAEANGIHRDTAKRWMKYGEQHELKYHPDLDDCTSMCDEESVAFRRFFTRIKQSQAMSSVKEMTKISNAGNQQWQASAWKLERTQPDLFGMKNRTEITGKDGGPILHRVLTNEQKQRLIDSAKETLLLENDDGVFEESE